MSPSPHIKAKASSSSHSLDLQHSGQKLLHDQVQPSVSGRSRTSPLAASYESPEAGPGAVSRCAGSSSVILEKYGSSQPDKRGSAMDDFGNAHLQLAEELKDFFCQSEGSALRAWMRHFDNGLDQKISLSEFMRGMRKLNYLGDIPHAFQVLDDDNSGELALDEIDDFQAGLWKKFKLWCVDIFEGPEDMIQTIAGCISGKTSVDEATFLEGLRKLGWSSGSEALLFSALDLDSQNELTLQHLKWLEVDKRRQRRKESAKKAALGMKHVRKGGVLDRRATEGTLQDFKKFLKQKNGNLLRAWRRVLSPDGSLTMHKVDLFKACRQCGWIGDVRLLWAAFDRDGSGEVSIEELDPQGAEVLAYFRRFIAETFGNTTAAFRALDKFNRKSLRRAEFLGALKALGFEFPSKSLFSGLDLEGRKVIVEEDLYFLDRWKPPAFLTAKPNQEAADELRSLILKTYKTFLQAWRQFLDVDGSNRCSWSEFVSCCRKLGWRGDIPGAWRALDDDLSGYISLAEIDAAASDTLSSFKSWATEEFGSVRSAFSVFDSDGSNEVGWKEFKKACRVYGFDCPVVKSVFQALDVEKSGTLSLDEVVFLDDWEFNEEAGEEDAESGILLLQKVSSPVSNDTNCTTYFTEGPGPASYVPVPTIGQGPAVPLLKFSGAFSFRKRLGELPGLSDELANMPSPATYNNAHPSFAEATKSSKPAFRFGSASRKMEAQQPSLDAGPGPGSYAQHIGLEGLRPHGPSAICLSRRPLRVHPLFRARSLDRPRPLTVGNTDLEGGPWSARLPRW